MAMELNVKLLKAADAAPIRDTLKLLTSRGYVLQSREPGKLPPNEATKNMQEVLEAWETNQLVETEWVHDSVDKPHDPNSCWNRCMP